MQRIGIVIIRAAIRIEMEIYNRRKKFILNKKYKKKRYINGRKKKRKKYNIEDIRLFKRDNEKWGE